MLQKGRFSANVTSASDAPSVTAAMRLGVWLAGTRIHQGSEPLRGSSVTYCSCGVSICSLSWCSKWKETKAAAAKRAQEERSRKNGASMRLPAPRTAPANPSHEQENLGPDWNRCGHAVKAQCTFMDA